jgi:3-hydroxyacyl-CoA dehydrogenase
MGTDIKRVAVIGTGVIGASWTALFLARGLEVTATDVAPGAEGRLRQFVRDAWPALVELGAVTHGTPDHLKFSSDLRSAVEGAQLVQENGPERIDFTSGRNRRTERLLSRLC